MKVTTPLALETPLAGEIVDCPAPWPRVTVLLGTGLLLASRRVTVTVVVVTPSSATLPSVGLTVEFAALTVPGVKVTTAVSVIATPSVKSTALYVTVCVMLSLTVKVTTPLLLETPLGADIVESPTP